MDDLVSMRLGEGETIQNTDLRIELQDRDSVDARDGVNDLLCCVHAPGWN